MHIHGVHSWGWLSDPGPFLQHSEQWRVFSHWEEKEVRDSEGEEGEEACAAWASKLWNRMEEDQRDKPGGASRVCDSWLLGEAGDPDGEGVWINRTAGKGGGDCGWEGKRGGRGSDGWRESGGENGERTVQSVEVDGDGFGYGEGCCQGRDFGGEAWAGQGKVQASHTCCLFLLNSFMGFRDIGDTQCLS